MKYQRNTPTSKSDYLRLSDIVDILQESSLLVALYGVDESFLVSLPVTDTRKITNSGKKGSKSSFICIRGYVTDGHLHAQDAVDKGVDVIISEQRLNFEGKITNIVVSDSRKTLAVLARYYFNDPSSKFVLIGVTGTNGKTSIVKIIEHLLLKKGKKVATIGTLGYSLMGEEYPLERTTPDIVELNSLLSFFVSENIEYVVMEVSSHALSLHRVYGLSFDYALFSNLSREHLDFHNDMEEYYQAKSRLFHYLDETKGRAIINYDDKYGKLIAADFSGRKTLIRMQEDVSEVESSSTCSIYRLRKQSLQKNMIELTIRDKDTTCRTAFETTLPGYHNAFNICASLTIVFHALDLRANDMKKNLNFLSSNLPSFIKGRLEKVENNRSVSCFIDYAHTPEALEHACGTLKSLGQNNRKQSRLICVFGAGGDRDKGKRIEMTKAVLKHADIAIITSDNPRSEDVRAIIFDQIRGLHPLDSYLVYCDRKAAINVAIDLATEYDIVLVAGKGHEKFQTIGNQKYEFDDYHEALTAINSREEKNSSNFDIHANASPSTSKLNVPLDPLQIKILLEWCSENDLGIDRWSMLDRYCDHYNVKSDSIRSKVLKDNSPQKNILTESISTDTRTILNNSCFIALYGDNYDGHDYVVKALLNTTNYAVITKGFQSPETDDHRLIFVDDTRLALALIAKKYRSLFIAKTIAITGSTGKTSVKEYCYAIYSQKKRVLKNVANENNIIGLAKTIFGLSRIYQYLLVELGTNKVGEMQVLADVSQPNSAIITNIGPYHLEAFKDLQGVYEEKVSLLNRRLAARIIPEDEFFTEQFTLPAAKIYKFTANTTKGADVFGKDSVRFSLINRKNQKIDYVIKTSDKKLFGQIINRSLSSFRLPTDISFLTDNAAFAISSALISGFSANDIAMGLDKPIRLKQRMEIVSQGNKYLLIDCYNANPTSMKGAIDHWIDTAPQLKHVAILGDMLELGDKAEELHLEIGKYLCEILSATQVIITVGDHAKSFGGEHHFNSVDEVSRWLDKQELFDTSEGVFLVKGSRGIHLERLIDKFRQSHKKPIRRK